MMGGGPEVSIFVMSVCGICRFSCFDLTHFVRLYNIASRVPSCRGQGKKIPSKSPAIGRGPFLVPASLPPAQHPTQRTAFHVGGVLGRELERHIGQIGLAFRLGGERRPGGGSWLLAGVQQAWESGRWGFERETNTRLYLLYLCVVRLVASTPLAEPFLFFRGKCWEYGASRAEPCGG